VKKKSAKDSFVDPSTVAAPSKKLTKERKAQLEVEQENKKAQATNARKKNEEARQMKKRI